ncbi:MAG: PCMD domain-containing protein [Rikenellaceae bacterium]
MLRRFIYILWVAILGLSVSCIKNDIPYPYQLLEITDLVGEGFTTSINSLTYTATLTLEETTDIRNVTITEATYSAEAKLDRALEGTFDMSAPFIVKLYNYQTYEWTVEAEQDISRTMEVVGQIGEATIDTDNLKVSVVISDAIDPSNVTVTALKLGPEGITTMTPSIEELTVFESVRQVYVTYHDRTEVWRIYASFEEAAVSFKLCTVLATRAWLETSGDTSSGEECGYMYRKMGDTEWTTVVVESPQSGFFEAEITGLTPETEYEFKTYIGAVESLIETRTTESVMQLSNSDFEQWHTDSWVRPYSATDTYPVWDTGNQGAKLGGATLTQSDTNTRPGSSGSYSARLTAQNVLIKFAAGNLFTGSYAGTYNTDGIISFGFPFTQRPIALRGWYKYTCGVMDVKNDSRLPTAIANTIVKGETPDIGTIYIALGTWEPQSYTYSTTTYPANEKSPIYVCTLDQSTFFDPTGEDVVAYGSLQKSETVSEWTQFEIPLEYYDKEILPTHIMIVASTSLYGDYFTGSTSSQMWLDDFELVYE